MIVSSADVEAARLRMIEVREALEDYEKAKGCAPSSERQRLSQAFRKATQRYLQLSQGDPESF
jgi:hypothetical protein